MDIENYFIESEPTILAVIKINKIVSEMLNEHYWKIIKGKKVEKEILDEILALNKSMLQILYCERKIRNTYYKMIAPDYEDVFNYDY